MGEIDTAREEWEMAIWLAPGCCPVCDRFGSVQDPSFTKGFLASLIWLYEKSVSDDVDDDGWIHVPRKGNRQMVTSNNVSKLALWGLSDRKPNLDDPKKNCVGFHRINERGVKFLSGKSRIPDRIYIYNKKRIPPYFMTTKKTKRIKVDQVTGYFDYQDTLIAAGLRK